MIMNGTQGYHTLRTEYVDGRGRRWCLTCRLPDTNERARKAHAAPATADPTKARILRE